jgi:hypothetical protein
MPFDRDIALHLATVDDQGAAGFEKIEMEIVAMRTDWGANSRGRASVLNGNALDLAVHMRGLLAELRIDGDLGRFLGNPVNAAAVDQQWDVSVAPLPEESKESIANRQQYLQRALISFRTVVTEWARNRVKEELLDLLDLLAAVRAPLLLVAPLASVAFAHLNALPEAQRRSVLGMAEDVYGLNDVLRQIAVATSAWAVPGASGTLHVETEPDIDALFAWPVEAAHSKASFSALRSRFARSALFGAALALGAQDGGHAHLVLERLHELHRGVHLTAVQHHTTRRLAGQLARRSLADRGRGLHVRLGRVG